MRALLLSTLALVACAPPPPGAPALRAVEPAIIDAALGADLALVGEWLLPVTTLDFDRPSRSTTSAAVTAWLAQGGVRVDLGQVTWVDATRVTGQAPAGLTPGTWDVHLVEPKGAELVLPAALLAQDCSDGECPIPLDGGLPPDGGAVLPCPSRNFRDRDLDGFGSTQQGNLCGPGWVAMGGDCEDRDALRSPMGLEVCNGLDDDCDGAADEGACADAGAAWTLVTDVAPEQRDLLAAWSYAPGALWVTAADRVYVRRDASGFQTVTAGCPANLKAVFAESNGDAVVAGGNPGIGRVAEHDLLSAGCNASRMVKDPMVALVGFVEGGSYEYVGLMRDGSMARWRRGLAPVETSSRFPAGAEVTDLHGVSPSQLFATGSVPNGTGRRMKVWALQPDGSWLDENVDRQADENGRLNALWVLSATDVLAVGEDGVVVRRSPSGWRRLYSDTNGVFTSVRAFAPGRFYVTMDDGRVRRRSGLTWSTLFTTTPRVVLTDLTGTSEEDLWAVGENGTIVRGPAP